MDPIEQRRAALLRANAVRLAAAQAKRDLAAGRLTLAEALRRPELGGASVAPIVRAVPKVGQVKATLALRAANVRPAARVNDLTPRQVDDLDLYARPMNSTRTETR